MVIVEFSVSFEKELKKHFAKKEALSVVKKLAKTKPTDGDYVASVASVVMKERKLNSFRFYFVMQKEQIRFLSKEELKKHLIRFIGLSKKNNQQKVIDSLKRDLKKFGLDL